MQDLEERRQQVSREDSRKLSDKTRPILAPPLGAISEGSERSEELLNKSDREVVINWFKKSF